MIRLYAKLAGLAALVGIVTAQDGGWSQHQVNATMCQWQEPRVAVIRDTVYIDGGYLWWQAGLDDGSYKPPTQDNNPLGLVYVLNFSTPFNVTQNMSDVFTRISKTGGGAANNRAQNFYDGAMFANDGEWYTYGGMVLRTSVFAAPPSDAVTGYEQYWYGASGKRFSPGFYDGTLSTNVTRYVSGGGAVSVPSENKGYYFSGLKAPGSGEIFYTTGNKTTDPSVVSNTLITFDMTQQHNETWTNTTLPTTVPGRANPELVWIPQGKQGLLVAIGGVINPVSATASLSLNDSLSAQSQTESPKFMSTVSIYDIATSTWYNQETSNPPPALTQGCTVVASAPDGSSHNIYWYGGFSGIDVSIPFSDDVYVLSLPSFTWTQVLKGNSTHGRAGHKCVKPYPDQMFVIGGYPTYPTTGPLTCLENTGMVQVLNLSEPKWLTSYDPSVWSNYTVPSAITAKIGGSSTGGATSNGPAQWSSDGLASLFSTSNSYDKSKIKAWYPYATQKTNTTNPRVPQDNPPSSSGGLPKWVPPVLGVVLGLVFLSAVLVVFLLWRRRRYLRSHPDEMTDTTDANRYRIASWLRGAGSGPGTGDNKAPTVTSSEESPDMESTLGDSTSNGHRSHPSQNSMFPVAEAAGNQVHEMPDTSQPSEMSADAHAHAQATTSNTGLAFLTSANLGSIGKGKGGLKPRPQKPSRHTSHTSHTSQSSVSDVSSPVLTPSSPGRPDSPSLGNEAHHVSGSAGRRPGHSRAQGSEVSSAGSAGSVGVMDEGRVVSGVSASSTERGVLARLGDEGGLEGEPHGVAVMPSLRQGLVSPPTPRGEEGGDYVSHGGSGSGVAVSPDTPGSVRSVRSGGVSGGGKRRSNFGEHLDED